MDEIRQKYIAINKRIFTLRDGEVFKMQKEYGATYGKSLGVPVVALEGIAKEYKPSHELARLLWDFGGREQTLVAAMLEEPEKIEQKDLEKHLQKVHTPEMWEQLTRQLLRRLPDIKVLITDWLESREEYLCIYAILTLGYLPDIFSEKLLMKIMQVNVKRGSYLQKCMQRVFLKLGIKDERVFVLLKQHIKMRTCYNALLDEIADFYRGNQ